ncbi:MAG: FecR family protein [Ginsengibacter sp.]
MSGTPSSNTDFNILLEKYLNNTCTKLELKQLLAMVENEKNKEAITQLMKNHWLKLASAKIHSGAELNLKFSQLMGFAKQEVPVVAMAPQVNRRNWRPYYAAAAIIFCIFSAGAFYFLNNKPVPQIVQSSIQISDSSVITPGGNKAILTLSNGTSINLTNAQNGALTTQGSIKISKVNGVLSYNSLNSKNLEMLYNTISTPRGGQYQLILTDGTKVWLNAASSLRFPANFVGKERQVELVGEAYFEVAHHAEKPFIVKLPNMEVEVLGTHFNINSYEDESTIKATLLEGSIKINQQGGSNFLKPGQQAEVNKTGDIKIIKKVDIESVIAWKNEKFQFDRADIKTIMRQIERWYDVDVEYEANISTHFGGSISRNVNLSQVLNIMQQTQKVKFKVEGQKVIVMP